MWLNDLTQEELKYNFHYDETTGIFKRKRKYVKQKVGTFNSSGYIQICINGRSYLAHRLAWLYVNGEWPSDQLDHINRDKTDNRISNLRLSNYIDNNRNRNNNKKFQGVYWNKAREKWESKYYLKEEGNIHLGYFKTYLAACYMRHYYEVTRNVAK